MDKNNRRAFEIRAYAAAHGVNYTSAMRTLDSSRGRATSAFGLAFAVEMDGRPVLHNPDVDHVLQLSGRPWPISCATQALVLDALIQGLDVHVVDVFHEGASFQFAKPWLASLADDRDTALESLTAIHAQMLDRLALAKKHGVSRVDQLSEGLRPTRLYLVINELDWLVNPRQHSGFYVVTDEERKLTDSEAAIPIRVLLERIARLGRAAGISMVISTMLLAEKNDTANLLLLVDGRVYFGQKDVFWHRNMFRLPVEDAAAGSTDSTEGFAELCGQAPRRIRLITDDPDLGAMTAALTARLGTPQD